MKSIVNKIFTAVSVMSMTISLTACGTSNLPVATELTNVPQYSASMIQDVQPQQAQQMLVKFKAATITRQAVNEFNAKYGTKTVQILPIINVYVVEMEGLSVQAAQAVNFMKKDPLVKYVELNNNIKINPNELGPVYTIQSNLELKEMVGKYIDLSGVYHTSRSGAVITTDHGNVSIVDVDGTVLVKAPGLTEGARVRISGIVKIAKGFNNTKSIGLMPLMLKK